MATVYITQRPIPTRQGWTPDFNSAAKYGKLEYVFEAGKSLQAHPQATTEIAKSNLEDFNPAHDFLLCHTNCNQIANAACIMALMAMGYNEIQFLYWNKDSRGEGIGFYEPIRLTF